MTHLLAILTLLSMAIYPAWGGDDDDWTVAESSSRSYHYAAPADGSLAIEVDTYAGSIRVRAGSAGSVEATVRETVRAVNPARAAQARKEVSLEAGQEGPLVRFYVDGPFRCHRDCGSCGDDEDSCSFRGDRWDDPAYEVAYDFELTVPPHADLTLRTVNRGDITVEGVEGLFSVRNVNGEVRLERVAGAGTARTVNGDVAVTLTRPPSEPWKLATINGDVDLALPSSAGVDARVQTMNGEAWSDFPYTTLPPDATASHDRRGRWVYRRGGTRLRLGPGGPSVALQTLNGDIRIRKNAR